MEVSADAEITMVSSGLTDVTNENTVLVCFVKFLINGPTGSERHEHNGIRWQVFVHVSRAISKSLSMRGYSAPHDSNRPTMDKRYHMVA